MDGGGRFREFLAYSLAMLAPDIVKQSIGAFFLQIVPSPTPSAPMLASNQPPGLNMAHPNGQSMTGPLAGGEDFGR